MILLCLFVQSAALVAVTNIAPSLDDQMIRKMVLPKTKAVFERNSGDLKLTLNVLACLTRVIDRLDKSAVIDEVLPLLWDVKLQDPEIIKEVVSKCESSGSWICFSHQADLSFFVLKSNRHLPANDQ